jgi:hypothetical protein
MGRSRTSSGSSSGLSFEMNTTTRSINPLAAARFTNRRLAREWKTVTAMVHIFCREQHGGSLCDECQELTRYISVRLDRCRFGEDKPTCARCPVHCYQRHQREQIKTVMRFAGPRMLWEHPWLSLCHMIDGWFSRSGPLPTVGRLGKIQ